MEIKKTTKEKRKRKECLTKENKNAIEFLDEHVFYYDEEDEQWFKEKDDQWVKNIPCYKEDTTKVVLNSVDFNFDMQNKDLDEFLKVPSPPRVHALAAPAPHRVYTFADLVSVPSAPRVLAPQKVLTSQVPAKSLEETFNNIESEQVHVPISYQHHLLPQNMKSNLIMLAGGSSRSVPRKKYIHWKKEEHILFLLGLEKDEEKGWKYI
ncbi:hypothetical protein JHK82_022607 [Glycine max]|nr:hypothetical protein JHK86_022627 [Glycine max]KAG5137876.1 hypothetical protein JHK82_022607 [Glycine max]